MPSAVAKKEEAQNLALAGGDPTDPVGQIKQTANNKVRNLEKRKNKLEALREDSLKGKPLTEEQKIAVQHIDDVERQIEVAKEFLTTVASIETSYNKQMKALKKKEEKEKAQTEVSRLRELLRFQDTLNSLGNDVVRQDFLNGNNGAVKFTQDELKRYDDIYKKLCPTREDLSEGQIWSQVLDDSAQFAHNLIVSLSKPAPGFESLTYKQLREFMEKLASCPYFENKSSRSATPEIEPASEGVVVEEHRRIEPTNSFDSSEHSATPSLYSANVPVVNGNNQHEQQRSRSPDVAPTGQQTITFMQDDQTVPHSNPVAPITYVPIPQPVSDYTSYNFAASQQQMSSGQVDAYQNYNQIFPDMKMNVAPSVGQQNQLPREQTAGSMLFVQQQNTLAYGESPMVSSANTNQKVELYNNNSEVSQGHADAPAPMAGQAEFGTRGRGGRGGYRGGRGRSGDGFRGSGRGGGWRGGRQEGSYEQHSNDYRNERPEDGGGFRRGGGRGGRGFDGGHRGRGSGGFRGGPYRGSERGGDRGRGRGGFRGGFGGARGGGRGAFVEGGQQA